MAGNIFNDFVFCDDSLVARTRILVYRHSFFCFVDVMAFLQNIFRVMEELLSEILVEVELLQIKLQEEHLSFNSFIFDNFKEELELIKEKTALDEDWTEE